MGKDSEMVRRAFRLVVQRGVILAGFVDVFQAFLFTLQGQNGWAIAGLCLAVIKIPQYRLLKPGLPFSIFLSVLLVELATMIAYITAASLEFGREAGFHYLLTPVFPLIMVSGRIGMIAKWGSASLLAVFILWLDRFAPLPASRSISYAFLTANGIINTGAAALMVSALMAYYYNMVVHASRRLEEMAYLDPLTGLMNRRRFEEVATARIADAALRQLESAIVIADIDHFKRINDTFGHEGGDQTLRQVGALICGTLGGDSIACRWGGEEFLLLLPGVVATEAKKVAERLRATVEHSEIGLSSGGTRVTMTFGVAPLSVGGDLTTAIRRADRALYEGKASGRNRVCLAQGSHAENVRFLEPMWGQ